MKYLYFNAARDAWSEITQVSYEIKLGRPRAEMSDGDMVLKVESPQFLSASLREAALAKSVDAVKAVVASKTPNKRKPATRRARKSTQVV